MGGRLGYIKSRDPVLILQVLPGKWYGYRCIRAVARGIVGYSRSSASITKIIDKNFTHSFGLRCRGELTSDSSPFLSDLLQLSETQKFTFIESLRTGIVACGSGWFVRRLGRNMTLRNPL